MKALPSATENQTMFPARISTDNGRAILEQFGVVFGERAAWSELYVYVTLPEGWQRLDNRDGRHLVDARGRYRVVISEKTAIYERYASATILRRYRVMRDANYEACHCGSRVIVTDGDAVLYASAPILAADQYSQEFYDAEQAANQAAYAWCDEHQPDWRDPAAYWD